CRKASSLTGNCCRSLEWPVLFLPGSSRWPRIRTCASGTHCSVICNEHPPILGIECDSMRIGKPGRIALQQSKRRLILLRVLPEHDHRAVVLQREEHLFRCFINGDAECSV